MRYFLAIAVTMSSVMPAVSFEMDKRQVPFYLECNGITKSGEKTEHSLVIIKAKNWASIDKFAYTFAEEEDEYIFLAHNIAADLLPTLPHTVMFNVNRLSGSYFRAEGLNETERGTCDKVQQKF